MKVEELRRHVQTPSEALESHETTFARQQKCYWREQLTEYINVLDIGMSDLINYNVNDKN